MRPAFADWLMSRLGVPSALVGDLQEEFQAGRSRAWYWRQTLRAAAPSVAPACAGFLAQVAVSAALYHFQIPRQLSWEGKWLLALAAGFGLPTLAVFIPERRLPAARASFESLGRYCALFVLIECGSWLSFWTLQFAWFLCSLLTILLTRPAGYKV